MAKSKTKSRRKLIVFTVILLALGGLAWWAFSRKQEVVITVQTEKIKRRDLTELVVATGKIQPVVQVVINPEVSGEIIELPVKEGQAVKKGDLLLRIKPDFYDANRNSANASLKSSQAGEELAKANMAKAEIELRRAEGLFKSSLISDSQLLDAKTSFDVARAQHESSTHQTDVARASLARADEDLKKTTITSPTDGTVTKLKSQRGERVVGTAMMAGTEIMTIAQLDDMEARVEIGEIDVVLIAIGQKARLEVDAFRERDRKFTGIVTEIANAAKSTGVGTQQEATKFEVKIRVQEKEIFRPGMSVTAEIETRYRTNVLTVPIQSVTTRMPKAESKTNLVAQGTNHVAGGSNGDPKPKDETKDTAAKKKEDARKPIEVVFLSEGTKAKQIPVKRGISDESFVEIVEGLAEGQEVVSGGYKAINRELEDGKLIKLGVPAVDTEKK
ncbi:MAG: efflux RND transporter periplasmic adaptor subunit [Verrucomicrobia bacterium]|nr:efflux RND transporter periplasmic adaptor subunit [Verrucomicrobiota bacterium]